LYSVFSQEKLEGIASSHKSMENTVDKKVNNDLQNTTKKKIEQRKPTKNLGFNLI